jgi:Fe-S oxidoreductase
MIDYKLVENIKAYGAYKDTGEGRLKVLKDNIGFMMDNRAEYVIIGGCLQPEGMPNVFRALKEVLDRLKVDYTMLSKEYCCGWVPLGQPAVMAKNEEDIAKARGLARDFILKNLIQAEALGAKSIALFCAACEPNYSNYQHETSVEIISYSELIDRHFESGRMNMKADYYAGCYRFRRKITTKPLDHDPAERVLKKIKGLEVNHLNSSLCCYIPPQLEQLTNSLTTGDVITICTGCYSQLTKVLKEKGNYTVKILPEVVSESLVGQ